MKISIVIPCYNESANIPHILEAFRTLDLNSHELELILVENGSTDNSSTVLADLIPKYPFAKAITVPINQGYGYGLLQGIEVTTGDYVGWLHADLQVAPDQLLTLIREADPQRQMFLKGLRVPSDRKLTERFFTFGMSIFETLVFHTWLYDISAIPVLFHRSLVPKLAGAPSDFSIELFAYYQAKTAGFQIVRQKIRMNGRKCGNSSWNHGFFSQLSQSMRIIKASFNIKNRR